MQKKNTSHSENDVMAEGYHLVFSFIAIRKNKFYRFFSLKFEPINRPF